MRLIRIKGIRVDHYVEEYDDGGEASYAACGLALDFLEREVARTAKDPPDKREPKLCSGCAKYAQRIDEIELEARVGRALNKLREVLGADAAVPLDELLDEAVARLMRAP